jgi:hypothetical protein
MWWTIELVVVKEELLEVDPLLQTLWELSCAGRQRRGKSAEKERTSQAVV